MLKQDVGVQSRGVYRDDRKGQMQRLDPTFQGRASIQVVKASDVSVPVFLTTLSH